MHELTLRPMSAAELNALTALFDYNDVPAMIAENTRLIESGAFSIYLLFEGDELIGELHVTWRSDDPLAAMDGQRAYLSAYRILEDRQGLGYGQFLLRGRQQRLHVRQPLRLQRLRLQGRGGPLGDPEAGRVLARHLQGPQDRRGHRVVALGRWLAQPAAEREA
jgi:hypothetical protein